MTRSAWFCPSCRTHHAPHVDSCPGAVARPLFPPGYQIGGMTCGCASPECREKGCQSLRASSKQAWDAYYAQRGIVTSQILSGVATTGGSLC